jgi:hypothetical protein
MNAQGVLENRSSIRLIYRISLACFVILALPSQTRANNCADGDKDCFLSWYKDFKENQLAWFKAAREFESDLAAVLRSRDEREADYLIGKFSDATKAYGGRDTLLGGFTADLMVAARLGVDEEYAVLAYDCRNAVGDLWGLMGFMNFDWSPQRLREDRAEYVREATACENKFKLGHPRSMLRR